MDYFDKIYRSTAELTSFGKLSCCIFGSPNLADHIRKQYFKRILDKIRWSYALDAGCGTGQFAFYLAKKYPYNQIDAFDIKGIEKNKEIQNKFRLKNINFFNQNLLNLDHKNKYDFVYIIGTLIYFSQKENEKILKKLLRSLRLGGYFYLEVPQKDWDEINIFSSRWYPTKKKFHEQQKPGYLYKKEEISELLSRIGFGKIEIKKTFGFFGKLSWEINQILEEKDLYRIRAISMPLLRFIGWIDTQIPNKRGGGLAILAQKLR